MAEHPTHCHRGSQLGRIAIAGALVVAATLTYFAARYAVRAKFREETISVTGSATKRIQSDLAVWTAWVHTRDAKLDQAYRALKQGMPRVQKFLTEHGIDAQDISVGSAATEELYARNEHGQPITETIIGYALRQPITVTSKRVDLVGRVSQDVSQVLESGVDVRSEAPQYIYTKLAELKIDLIAAAAKDARTRAEQTAKSAGSGIAGLSSAKVGVIQINPANESNVSWEGMSDRTSIEKDAMAVVTTVFYLK